jgi:hypothetical protein
VLKRFSLLFTLCCLLVSSPNSLSSPWIGTIEPLLYNDLQTLTEWGYIEAAITSFPVPWKGIAQQIEGLNESELPATAVVALQRLKHYLQRLKNADRRSFVTLYGATDKSRFTSFDDALATQAKLTIDNEFYAGRWAANFSVNYLPGGEKNLDHSFVAYQFGDWNLRLGSIDQWWGPATSSSLILSNNARPIPSIALSRAESGKSQNAWLSVLGSWYFTTQLGQLESNRHIADTKLLMSRFNFKPIAELEIGASWLTMWGGLGQGNGLGDFWDALSLASECSTHTEPCDSDDDATKGNHVVALDVKYTAKLVDVPISIYSQLLAETRDAQPAKLFGIASYIKGYRVYLETSDTNVGCSDNRQSANCIYEDSVYQSGLRYHHRAIGSTFDSDAEMLSLGLNKHFADGDVLELALKRLKLNPDMQMPSPVVVGNTEKIHQLSGFYQTNWGKWQIKVGGQFEQSKVDLGDSSTNKLVYTQFKYAIN